MIAFNLSDPEVSRGNRKPAGTGREPDCLGLVVTASDCTHLSVEFCAAPV